MYVVLLRAQVPRSVAPWTPHERRPTGRRSETSSRHATSYSLCGFQNTPVTTLLTFFLSLGRLMTCGHANIVCVSAYTTEKPFHILLTPKPTTSCFNVSDFFNTFCCKPSTQRPLLRNVQILKELCRKLLFDCVGECWNRETATVPQQIWLRGNTLAD